MKSTRKNRFKKENAKQRARLRARMAFLARALMTGLALAALSAGFILVHDFFVQSPQFLAHDIVVSGNRRLEAQQVLAIAGIDRQTNILALNLTTTRKRLLADPWIADATVSRKIPSQISIIINEERPLAFLEMGNGLAFLLNVDGRVFKRSAGTDGTSIPHVQGLNLADLPVSGKPNTATFQSVMTLLRLAREGNSPLPYRTLSRIHMDRKIGATVHTDQGNRDIKLGFGHYREKVCALRHLMTRMQGDSRLARCQVIDLYDVNRIVITPAPAGRPGSDQEEV